MLHTHTSVDIYMWVWLAYKSNNLGFFYARASITFLVLGTVSQMYAAGHKREVK